MKCFKYIIISFYVLLLCNVGRMYSAPSDLDPSFDSDGIQTVDFGGEDTLTAIAFQSSTGKIVGVGRTSNGGGAAWAITRLNIDGSLDTTFDTDGKVTTDLASTDDFARDVAIQADGKIVVVGNGPIAGATADFFVARYNTDGSLDAGFGTAGIANTDVSGAGDNNAFGVAIQSDGKILVVGRAGIAPELVGIVRYNTDGSLDAGFGAGGIVTTNFSGVGGANNQGIAVLVQGDGKIVVAATTSDAGAFLEFGIARYNADGSLDGTFGTGGITVTKITAGRTDQVTSAAFQSDGKIVVGGSTSPAPGETNYVLVRYTTAGLLDAGFGTAGITQTNISTPDDVGKITIQSDDKIVFVGGDASGDYTVLRFTAGGILDPTFGAGGVVTTDVTGSTDIAEDVVIQPDGRILVGGSSGIGEPAKVFSFVRYLGEYICTPVVGSDSVVEYFNTFQQVGASGRIASLAVIQNGFILCGDATFDSVFPVAGKICLNDFTLTLGKDLIMRNISSISSLGGIIGNGHVLDVAKSVTCIPTLDCPDIVV